MTWKKWSRELKRFLSPLPKSERQTIVAYYREIFEDKLDSIIKKYRGLNFLETLI